MLLTVGLAIGFIGTLIGAGGGFLLVPLLLFTHPEFPPEIVTAISIAVVACNAVSGSLAYLRSGRVDLKAGLLFAVFTIPGSVLGVFLTRYLPTEIFNFIFGLLLIALAVFLFVKKKSKMATFVDVESDNTHLTHHTVVDKFNITYHYSFHKYWGILISVIVGFVSPLLGIGGGIIHVPAMVHWLNFPVHIATATSHFILAIMATISVVVHAMQGNYSDPHLQKITIGLCMGVIVGAQLGAGFSHHVRTHIIVKALAVCLALVGVRLLMNVI